MNTGQRMPEGHGWCRVRIEYQCEPGAQIETVQYEDALANDFKEDRDVVAWCLHGALRMLNAGYETGIVQTFAHLGAEIEEGYGTRDLPNTTEREKLLVQLVKLAGDYREAVQAEAEADAKS